MVMDTATQGRGPSGAGVPRERVHGYRRVLSTAASRDSYGSVLVLLAVTYVTSVSVSDRWAGSAVLVLQIGTVWLALRVSRARRGVRLVATVGLVVAAIVAV